VYYAEISGSTEALAGFLDGADLSMPVPTCPEWTLKQLVTHVGRAQRWAAEIVSTRSADFIPFRSVPDGRLPDDRAEHGGWLCAGADRLIGAVTQAGDDRVWAHGVQRPATYWARRMAHETAVHRADAEIAFGRRPLIAPDVAADGVDEWLTVLSVPVGGEPDLRRDALAEGQSLHVHAADVPEGTGEWLVSHDPAGVTVRRVHGKGAAALRGGACDLLLVLMQRLPPDDPGVQVLGDPAVLTRWLAVLRF
jgi:uncharacterized protein (TIGR03083 family)